MGTIEISTEPHELIINGTTILMQADPTASSAWVTLLEAEWSYQSAEAIQTSIAGLTDALAGCAETDTDAETLRSLGAGLPTLQQAAKGYVTAVTGFPTQPPSGSTKRSKRT